MEEVLVPVVQVKAKTFTEGMQPGLVSEKPLVGVWEEFLGACTSLGLRHAAGQRAVHKSTYLLESPPSALY